MTTIKEAAILALALAATNAYALNDCVPGQTCPLPGGVNSSVTGIANVAPNTNIAPNTHLNAVAAPRASATAAPKADAAARARSSSKSTSGASTKVTSLIDQRGAVQGEVSPVISPVFEGDKTTIKSPVAGVEAVPGNPGFNLCSKDGWGATASFFGASFAFSGVAENTYKLPCDSITIWPEIRKTLGDDTGSRVIMNQIFNARADVKQAALRTYETQQAYGGNLPSANDLGSYLAAPVGNITVVKPVAPVAN